MNEMSSRPLTTKGEKKKKSLKISRFECASFKVQNIEVSINIAQSLQNREHHLESIAYIRLIIYNISCIKYLKIRDDIFDI